MTTPELGKRRRQVAFGVAAACLLAVPFAYSAVVVPLTAWEQAQVSLVMIGLAILASLSRPLRPLIVFLSAFASLRYFHWRVTSTLNLDGPLDAGASFLLLGAEVYGVLVLFLGYFQTIDMEKRTPPPIRKVPTVDVFVPTYNEPIEIVRRTLIGALAMEYPRKQVFLLDDGRREAFEAMARELGCFYLTRSDNAHAKAGNLNAAVKRTHGDLIAIFDADHVPVRGFLRKTVGFFEDETIGLVQAAQHFFNPDPFERNLNLQGRIAPEQTFFYHVIQPGNDFWNSAFFCGSCAVLRRSALESIGGFKVSTVTEDAHTALELHARGWRSAYLGLPLAAGLATESFAAHVVQRMRWARGMAQILRLDCPLFKRGLRLPQRLNYFNAMLHFFFGLPRLAMIAAPLAFL
ncbi:MAG TPA: glycosyltransferase, partial [Vicinamibacteria bacterium]|nr:glycosyltransferase [Vicinamibacteria bacterium]